VENQKEMDEYLDTCNKRKLSHEDTDHTNRSITSNEIEAVMKSLSTKKSQYPVDS
jgi:hypothetical protein